MKELFKILKQFYDDNKKLVLFSVITQVLYSTIASVIIPYILSGAFNNINNSSELKKQMMKLVFAWVIIKTIGCVSLHYHNQLEPEISRYITLSIVKSVFQKYENERYMNDVSVMIDKIHLIRNNIHEFAFLFFTIIIPKLLVISIILYNFTKLNLKLGLAVFVSMIVNYFAITHGLNKCVNMTYKTHQDKDRLYSYIEDLFTNISTIQSTPNAYEYEVDTLDKFTRHLCSNDKNSFKCINKKQYRGYTSNVIIFILLIYIIYTLYNSRELTPSNTTTSILLLISLFDNLGDLTFFITEFSFRYGILKSNEQFLKSLITFEGKHIPMNLSFNEVSNNIEFNNVSFRYSKSQQYCVLDKFSLSIPKNSIVVLYGASGSGKTSFIKLLYGLEKPQLGNIIMNNNMDVSKISPQNMRQLITIIEQNTMNLFNRSVFENITYGMSSDQLPSIRKYISSIFDKYNFYSSFKHLDKDKNKFDFLDMCVGKSGELLSGGQKKLIHVMKLCINPNVKIVILDEPTNGLDNQNRDNLKQFLRDMNKQQHISLYIITHDTSMFDLGDMVLEFSTNANPVIKTN